MAKLELEKDKLAIQNEIEKAEISREAKDHIRRMAMKTTRKLKKGNRPVSPAFSVTVGFAMVRSGNGLLVSARV